MPRTPTPAPFSQQLAVGAAVALWLFSAFAFYQVATAQQAAERDPYLIQVQPSRLSGVVGVLPPSATVGYLSDVPLSSTAGLAAFGGVRFALAPRLVVPGADQEWVVGNFARPSDFASLGAQNGLTVHADYQNGIVLFQRAAKR